VIGWAGHPLQALESPGVMVPGYRAATWPGGDVGGPINRANAKPPVNQFCDASNQCEPGAQHTPDAPEVIGEPAGPCAHRNGAGQYDLKCWYHQSSTWKSDCNVTCGREVLRFDPGFAYQEDGTAYPPKCTRDGLPVRALIIDDQPDNVPSVRPDCRRTWVNSGTFTLSYKTDSAGRFPGKIDTHQLGAGLGGHFWFSHTNPPGPFADQVKVTGTWRLNQAMNGWARVIVHMPDHGAHTQRAQYTVQDGSGLNVTRSLLQRTEENRWVSLGAFPFSGTPAVSLSNITDPADGSEDVAWDAIALQPLPGKPHNQIVVLGDSYASGENAATNDGKGTEYYRETDNEGGTNYRNACHRSRESWSRKTVLSDGLGQSIGSLQDAWDPDMDFHFLACSQARTENMLPTPAPGETPIKNAYGKGATSGFREGSQLDRGFLDNNTTMVAFSIGGNDAGFTNVIRTCFVTDNCKDQVLPNGRTLDAEVRANIDNGVTPSVNTVLQEVLRRVGTDTKVVLMTYPVLFSGTCGAPSMTGVNIDWLRDIAIDLRDHLVGLVQPPPLFAHTVAGLPMPYFEGKGVCGNPEAIGGLITTLTPGEPPGQLASQQSFHPNMLGTSLYAQAFEEALARP
jgi:hypothetical protein